MDGGQYRKIIKAEIKTSDTTDYASIIYNAIEAYRPGKKCKLAEREFLHLRNDLFLITLASAYPEQNKH